MYAIKEKFNWKNKKCFRPVPFLHPGDFQAVKQKKERRDLTGKSRREGYIFAACPYL
jgi:hypothetical protein